ncbi:hypothetical protein SAMN05443270_1079 [Lacrimispora sphenoides]|uniref:hypothetical protein n=1 Tax=Lacrimispora sphenoides TaxID=29370 RepID=UPI0008B3C309|nr:hypothetical protein [Lacrimispora sphenoides]SET71298.1 hypothetical protein SAMN05443270_1079 [Lacrimispora sphenoides]
MKANKTVIKIMQDINGNNQKEQSCPFHEFEVINRNGIPKYQCKRCGCVEDILFVKGYKRGIEHALDSEMEVSNNLFGETKYTYLGKADKGGDQHNEDNR